MFFLSLGLLFCLKTKRGQYNMYNCIYIFAITWSRPSAVQYSEAAKLPEALPLPRPVTWGPCSGGHIPAIVTCAPVEDTTQLQSLAHQWRIQVTSQLQSLGDQWRIQPSYSHLGAIGGCNPAIVTWGASGGYNPAIVTWGPVEDTTQLQSLGGHWRM